MTQSSVGFPVSHSAPRPEERIEPSSTSGRKCSESSGRVVHAGCLLKTWRNEQLSVPQKISDWPNTRSQLACFLARRLVASMTGIDGGLLPTPTRKANHWSPSMTKWPAYRRLQALGPNAKRAVFWEWQMGLPVGWTDLECELLAMEQYRSKLRSLVAYFCGD